MDLEKSVLSDRINKLKLYGYAELLSLIQHPIEVEEISINGKAYQIDTRCFFEDKANKTIRVTVSLFAPKEYAPWWKFWKNIDTAVISDSFTVLQTK